MAGRLREGFWVPWDEFYKAKAAECTCKGEACSLQAMLFVGPEEWPRKTIEKISEIYKVSV